MILRQLASRQCRNAIVKHGRSATVRRRAFANGRGLFQSDQTRSDASLGENITVSSSPAFAGTGGDRAVAELAYVEMDGVGEAYAIAQHTKRTTARYGTDLEPHYRPHTLISNPPRAQDVTLELLLASQAHMGHSTSLWNPSNSKYIFGVREGIHIISLDATASHLRRAAKVVSGVAEQGGIILFVGTRPGQDRCVVRAAELAGGCHLFDRWTPGTITNAAEILGQCRLQVVDEFDQAVPGFDAQLAEQAPLKPDLVICLNPLENHVLLLECSSAGIPTIGIIDTDANPTWVTYPIPANDDSLRCVQVIAGALGRAGQEGQMRRRQAAKEGVVTYFPANLRPPSDDIFLEPESAEVEGKMEGEGGEMSSGQAEKLT